MRGRATTVAALAGALCAPGLLVAPSADARDAGERVEVRVQGVCGPASAIRLRLRADGAVIRVDTDIRSSRAGSWRLTLLHERRVVVRVQVAAAAGGLRHSAALPDYEGADSVSVRAVAPSGETCTALATVAGSARRRS
jgi:hypothetical protein